MDDMMSSNRVKLDVLPGDALVYPDHGRMADLMSEMRPESYTKGNLS